MSIKEKTHDHTNDTNLLVEMWSIETSTRQQAILILIEACLEAFSSSRQPPSSIN